MHYIIQVLKVLLKYLLTLYGLVPTDNPKILPYYKFYLCLQTVLLCIMQGNYMIILINYKSTPTPIRVSGVFYAICLMVMNMICHIHILKYYQKFYNLLCVVDKKQFSPITLTAIAYGGVILSFRLFYVIFYYRSDIISSMTFFFISTVTQKADFVFISCSLFVWELKNQLKNFNDKMQTSSSLLSISRLIRIYNKIVRNILDFNIVCGLPIAGAIFIGISILVYVSSIMIFNDETQRTSLKNVTTVLYQGPFVVSIITYFNCYFVLVKISI